MSICGPKLILLFTAEGWSAQPYSIYFDWLQFVTVSLFFTFFLPRVDLKMNLKLNENEISRKEIFQYRSKNIFYSRKRNWEFPTEVNQAKKNLASNISCLATSGKYCIRGKNTVFKL